TTAMESTTMESAAAVEPATAMEPAAAMEAAPAVGAATAHLRVGGSDTAENRECRDTCDCKFLHPRLSHGRTSFTPSEKQTCLFILGSCLPPISVSRVTHRCPQTQV